MTAMHLRIAIALVRGWTCLYTCRMAAKLREARRAEIESDLFEFQQDSTGRGNLSPTFHVLTRLLLGIPDDLSWRIEHGVDGRTALRRLSALTGVAVLVAIFAMSLGVIASALSVKPLVRRQPAQRVILIRTSPPATLEQFQADLERLQRELTTNR
jgi:hypothetical protein